MSEHITIEDVQRLDVRPGDVLLVTVPADTTPDQVTRLVEVFESRLPDVRVIVKGTSVGVEVVAADRQVEQIQRAVDAAKDNPGKTLDRKSTRLNSSHL